MKWRIRKLPWGEWLITWPKNLGGRQVCAGSFKTACRYVYTHTNGHF